MTNEECTRWIFERLRAALPPHAARLRRIALDRELALVFYKPDTGVIAKELLALRPSGGDGVVQLNRTRVHRIFGKAASDPIAKWAMRRAHEGGSKILVATDRFFLLVNMAADGKLTLDPATFGMDADSNALEWRTVS